ncbi:MULTISPECIES: ABC transporter permease subunit [unclassified Microbacterium]|uniref:ABC transporter permease subunit n=1 Tax=unclassified Microbacterium TaxID=2609290 RepID=UPI00214CD5DF|nr:MULTISPECIES: ABC transporter permease subunit [unclassified Microbacterium]MCR2809515.1 ABC transporter permease subunit [Microbacterium sp. zg.B185]WIM20649.1 ABC transporter permease subunit [Microbacterium sp. zg-B185]
MRELALLRRTLRESWRGLLGWTAGVAAALALYLPLFPSIGGNGQLQQVIESLPPELVAALGYDQIGTGAGYTQSTFYGLIGFLLLSIAAIAWGAGAVAGAEESGRLELDLAHGIARRSYALQSALAMLLRLLWLSAAAGAIVALLDAPATLGLDGANIVGATVALWGLTALCGAVALLAGALSGRRLWAIGAGAGVAVLGYVLTAVANQLPEAEWLRSFSPYSWAYHQSPLADGADPVGLTALWAATAVLIAACAGALQRRDVTG